MKRSVEHFSLLVALVFLASASFAAEANSNEQDTNYSTGGKISDLQKNYDAVFYDINLEVDSKNKLIFGFVKVGIKPLMDNLSIIELDLIDNFEISKVELNNIELDFNHKNNKLIISLQNRVKENQYLELNIYYTGEPLEAKRPPWIGGFNWSKDEMGNDWIGVSCQGEGGKIWFPCKDHPSDEPDSVAINITIPKPYYCASNGILEKVTEPKEGFSTYHWFTRYPTNNYNISINIAKYDVLEKSYTSINGNKVPVIYYYLNDPEERADSLVNMAIDMLKTFEKFYGEYPFAKEKFGLAETDYWGMEHQTVNSYGNNYRYTEVEGLKFDQLMLHEMTHEWWGNKVTVKDWADFWIHEGIGTYSEAVYLLDNLGEKAYHDHISKKRNGISNSSPILKSKNTASIEAYIGDIYTKGAYFMHSLRYALEDSIFFSTLYRFANDSDYIYKNLVDTEDFLKLVNKNSGKDYSAFFNLFLRTTDLPDVLVDSLEKNKWNISIPNINFQLPMDIEIDAKVERIILGPKPVLVESETKISVDPQNWYLHKKDFLD